jgi:hypothetical protein
MKDFATSAATLCSPAFTGRAYRLRWAGRFSPQPASDFGRQGCPVRRVPLANLDKPALYGGRSESSFVEAESLHLAPVDEGERHVVDTRIGTVEFTVSRPSWNPSIFQAC